MTFPRRTLTNPARFEGLGLHTGTPVVMTVHPGEAGIRFRLGSEIIAATPENVSDTTRCTRIGPVSTIEHIMSALAGLEITDAEVELTSPEVPGMDGSAGPYVEEILRVGTTDFGEQGAPKLYRRVFLKNGAEIAIAKGSGHWRYTYETGPRWPGTQTFESRDVVTDYRESIAFARTFALSEELPTIQKMGLGRGPRRNLRPHPWPRRLPKPAALPRGTRPSQTPGPNRRPLPLRHPHPPPQRDLRQERPQSKYRSRRHAKTSPRPLTGPYFDPEDGLIGRTQ